MQKLITRAWKDLWPNEELHKDCRHLLGNLALLPDIVNESVGNSALMGQLMPAYNEGTVHFLSTSELTVHDWDIEHLLARHEKIITAIAQRYDLPVSRFAHRLPQLSSTARGEKVTNTNKWK